MLGALTAAHYTRLLNTLTLYMAALGRTEAARRTDSGGVDRCPAAHRFPRRRRARRRSPRQSKAHKHYAWLL